MPSFGESLRRERELRQITLREISEATKISLRYLEALERNDFRHLPGGVFNKGFIRAFSQYIGVEPEAMVTAYLVEESRQRTKEEERQRESLRRAEALQVGPLPGREKERSALDLRRRLVLLIFLTALLVLVSGGIVAALKMFLSRRAPEPTMDIAVVVTAELDGSRRETRP